MTDQATDEEIDVHRAASAGIHLLPCPVCSAPCTKEGSITDTVGFRCSQCPHKTFAPLPATPLDQWRDGAMEWNREARKK